MHHNRNLAVLCSAIAAGAFGPGLAHANPVVTMTLTGVEGPSMGGVYTSPYMATIGSSPGVGIYCDDFLTHVSVGESWQATVTNMGELESITSPLQTLKFDTTGTGTPLQNATEQQDQYMEAAWLAEQLSGVDQSTTSGQQEAGQLSFAIWGIFDPNALSDISGMDYSNAKSDISAAMTQITMSGYTQPDDYSNVSVYTAYPNAGVSQEYLSVSSVPEPGTLSFFGLGLAAMMWGLRRRPPRYARAVA